MFLLWKTKFFQYTLKQADSKGPEAQLSRTMVGWRVAPMGWDPKMKNGNGVLVVPF